MSEQTAQEQRYLVSVHEPEQEGTALIFTFVPKGLQQERDPGGIPKRVAQFIIGVRETGDGLAFDWSGTPDDPGHAREEMEEEIAARMNDRRTWSDRIASLVSEVEQWAREMGWSTRRVEKKLDDGWIGKHRVPALLIQQETCRALLEPIAPSTPGAEGLVDLYLMPAYDDIASLYYYGDRWNVHYHVLPGVNGVASMAKVQSMPLSKETLERVLVEMRQNAA